MRKRHTLHSVAYNVGMGKATAVVALGALCALLFCYLRSCSVDDVAATDVVTTVEVSPSAAAAAASPPAAPCDPNTTAREQWLHAVSRDASARGSVLTLEGACGDVLIAKAVGSEDACSDPAATLVQAVGLRIDEVASLGFARVACRSNASGFDVAIDPAQLHSSPPRPAGLTAEEIERVVRTRSGQLRACYMRALSREPALAGKLVMQFSIDGDGHVTTASTAGLDNAAISDCIVGKLRSLLFPASGGVTHVKLPVVLSPG
jgi:hypothetical protein